MKGRHTNRPDKAELSPPYTSLSDSLKVPLWEEWARTQENELQEEKARLERYGFTDRDDYELIKKLLGKEAS